MIGQSTRCAADAETAAQQSRIAEILQTCPTAGEGVNHWLFVTALKLHRLGVNPDVIEQLLEEATTDCGRDLQQDEIPRAVRNSGPDRLANYKSRLKWPKRNYEQIEAIGADGIGVAALEAESPVSLDRGQSRSEEIVDALFPGNPLLCVGPKAFNALTRPREQWRGFLSRQQFIVPSPMSKVKGITQEGTLSYRSLDNVGPRKFLVVEFDFVASKENGDPTPAAGMLRRLEKAGVTIADLCASLHARLAMLRPLALVVYSGGKSLHGWYPCNGETEEAVMDRFMRLAVSLGADKATYVRAQFVRMPDGLRDNGKRQRILYFNPAVIGGTK